MRPTAEAPAADDLQPSRRTRLRALLVLAAAAALALPGVASAAPRFVQQASTAKMSVPTSGITIKPSSPVTAGNRLVVQVEMWHWRFPTAGSVTDSAGNTYTKILSERGPDGTDMTIWTAPVTQGGGTAPTITVTPTARASVGVSVAEYAGLSTAPGTGAVDVFAKASGHAASAGTVRSGATAPASGAGLAVGFYSDSGFDLPVTADTTYTQRVNTSPSNISDLLVEDRLVAAGATPNAGAGVRADVDWLMATVVFKAGADEPPPPAPEAPGAPTSVTATAGDRSAKVEWTAPADGGSPITRYTVTPYAGTQAQPATTVTGSPPATTATVTGLTNGTAYTFKVSATNAAGTGPDSAASDPVTPTAPPASPGGTWSTLMDWPLVAIHAILLKNGRYLFWDGWSGPQPTDLWDMTAQSFTTTVPHYSIFCAANSQLPDGRILVAGGHGQHTTGELGIVDTTIYDPGTGQWTPAARMKYPRWYPSLTELADGRYVAISGNTAEAWLWADTPEVYDPESNTWTPLYGVDTSEVHETEYPYSYLLPSGKVFTIGPSADRSFLLDVDAKTWTPAGGASGVRNGSSVMYRPGKILYTGGAASLITAGPAGSRSALIDLTSAAPAWRETAPMRNARVFHTLTMLADGRVFAVGGEQISDSKIVTEGVLETEIFDPATETWSPGAPMAAARNYHSTALLMPDGRVLVAGGGHAADHHGPGQFSAQIYSPDYLDRGPRPEIASAPSAAYHGSNITVGTSDPASIKSVHLVSLGANTHQSTMSQHFVPLDFTAGTGGLDVKIPANSALAPPAPYMLFIVDKNGVPSVARFIDLKLTPPTAPAAPGSVVATAGDGSATVSWSAPATGGSPITSYTVTPYSGSVALPGKTVTGTPPATATTVTGLTNGTTYTFKVTATNEVGESAPSEASNPVTPGGAAIAPAFVQQATAAQLSVTTNGLTVRPTSPVTLGNRLVVQVEMWNFGSPTAASVTDSAGNTYTRLLAVKAPDGTDMTIWSAPVTAGGGTAPTITVKPSSGASMGISVAEYAGLSNASGTGAVDVTAKASGRANSATTVSSGPTPATTGKGLAIGFYSDSGFAKPVTADPAFTERVNTSPSNISDLLVEDRQVVAGATPNASATIGANVDWLMATVVFKGS